MSLELRAQNSELLCLGIPIGSVASRWSICYGISIGSDCELGLQVSSV